MAGTDIIIVKCPACEGTTSGKVAISDLRAGRATLTCQYCGQQIHVPPHSYFSGGIKEFIEGFRIFRELFILILLTSFIRDLASNLLHLALWMIDGLLVLLYAGAVGLSIPRMRQSIRRISGQPRWQNLPSGLNVREPIRVSSVHEEYNILDLKRCYKCKGPLRLGIHRVISTSLIRNFLAKFLGNELLKVCDEVEAECQSCKLKWSYYFNIDQIPYVRELGVTGDLKEMVETHLKVVEQEHRLREQRTLPPA